MGAACVLRAPPRSPTPWRARTALPEGPRSAGLTSRGPRPQAGVRRLVHFDDPKRAQGVLVRVGDSPVVKDLHVSVELGRIGHGEGRVSDCGGTFHEGADRARVELCAQKRDPKLVKYPPPSGLDCANVLRIRHAAGVTCT